MEKLFNGWSYEVSDFGNGYVLYTPGGKYLQDTQGHPILLPTVEAMNRVIAEAERPSCDMKIGAGPWIKAV